MPIDSELFSKRISRRGMLGTAAAVAATPAARNSVKLSRAVRCYFAACNSGPTTDKINKT
jgi:hypothetical protein